MTRIVLLFIAALYASVAFGAMHGSTPSVTSGLTAGSVMPEAAAYYGASGTWGPLVPGATYTSSDGHNETLPAAQQGSLSESPYNGYNDPAVAVWASPVLGSLLDSGSIMVCAYATHPSGILKVGFAVDEGRIDWVTTPASYPSIIGGSLVQIYCANISASSLNDGQHEARAIAVPNVGYVTVLQSQANAVGTNGSAAFSQPGHPWEIGKPLMAVSTTDAAITKGDVYCVWGSGPTTITPTTYELQGPISVFTSNSRTPGYACPAYYTGTSGLIVNASFSGTLSSGTLTVSGVQGAIQIGATLTGASVPSGTTITSGSGTTWVTTASSTSVGPETMTTTLAPVVSSGGSTTLVPVGAGTLLEQPEANNSLSDSESAFFLTNANGHVNENTAWASTGVSAPSHCGTIAGETSSSPCATVSAALLELVPTSTGALTLSSITNDGGTHGCLAVAITGAATAKPWAVGDAVIWGANTSGNSHDVGYGTQATGQPANILQTFHTYYISALSGTSGTIKLHLERTPTGNDAHCIPYPTSGTPTESYPGIQADLSYSYLKLQCGTAGGTCPPQPGYGFALGSTIMSYAGEGYLTIEPDTGVTTANVPLTQLSGADGIDSLATHYKNLLIQPATYTVTTCGNSTLGLCPGSTVTGLNTGGPSAYNVAASTVSASGGSGYNGGTVQLTGPGWSSPVSVTVTGTSATVTVPGVCTDGASCLEAMTQSSGSGTGASFAVTATTNLPAGTQNVLTTTGYGPITSTYKWVPVNTGGAGGASATQGCVSIGNNQSQGSDMSDGMQIYATAVASNSNGYQITLGGQDADNVGSVGNTVYNGGLWANCPDGTQITFATTLTGEEVRLWWDTDTFEGPTPSGEDLQLISANWNPSQGYMAETNVTYQHVAGGSLLVSLSENTVSNGTDDCIIRSHAVFHFQCDNVDVNGYFLATTDQAFGSSGTGTQISFATGTLPAAISRNWLIQAPTGSGCASNPNIVSNSTRAYYYIASILYNSGGHDIVTVNGSGFPSSSQCPSGTTVMVQNMYHSDFDFQNIVPSRTMSVIDDAQCGTKVNAPSCDVTSALFTQNGIDIDYVRKDMVVDEVASVPSWSPAQGGYVGNSIDFSIIDHDTTEAPGGGYGGEMFISNYSVIGPPVAFTLTDSFWDYDTWVSTGFGYTKGQTNALILNNVIFNNVTFGSALSELTLITPTFTNVTVENSACPSNGWSYWEGQEQGITVTNSPGC